MSDQLPTALATFGKELFDEVLKNGNAVKIAAPEATKACLNRDDNGFSDIAYPEEDYAGDRLFPSALIRDEARLPPKG